MTALQRGWRRATKLLRLLPRAPYRRGLRHGVAASIEHAPVVGGLAVGTVVDVGANVGQFSLLARTLHPHASIIAFEPLSCAADRYRRLFADDRGVTLHQLALGRETGTATLHVSAAADSSSLLPIGDTQNEIFPGTSEVGLRTVRVARLDDAVGAADLTPPVLLKIDVQGAELAVLQGAARTLPRVDFVYVEASFLELYEGQALADDVLAFLREHGFRACGEYNGIRDRRGARVQADFLLRRC